MIIGSDLLYQQNHSTLLASFINKYVNAECEIIIVDPNRGNHSKFKKAMLDFGFEYEKIDTMEYTQEPFKGSIHKYKKSKEKNDNSNNRI
jgi:predicted nicotinamide N-methyase